MSSPDATTGARTRHAGDAPAATEPDPAAHWRPAPPPPPPAGAVTGPGGERAVFMTEEQYLAQTTVRQSHSLPIGLVVAGVTASLGLAAASASSGGGGQVVAGCIGVLITLVVTWLLNSGVGWLVAKIFATDFGSAGVLLLRFGAVTGLNTAAVLGLSMVMDPMLANVLAFPVLIVLVTVLIGMDLMQAVVFTVVLGMLSWIMMSIVMLSIASAIGGFA